MLRELMRAPLRISVVLKSVDFLGLDQEPLEPVVLPCLVRMRVRMELAAAAAVVVVVELVTAIHRGWSLRPGGIPIVD